MMKKYIAAILSLALAGAIALPTLAADAPIAPNPAETASVEQKTSLPTGWAVEIKGEETDIRAAVMVPLRATAEKLGFTVTWNDGTITLDSGKRYAELTIGVDQYFAAPSKEGLLGASLFSLGCAPFCSEGVTYVPVELFEALLGRTEGTVTLDANTVQIGTATENNVQIPNPFANHANLTQAAQAVGFSITAPDMLDGYFQRIIQTIRGEMIQIIYRNDDSVAQVRKAAGNGDISGDYHDYSQVKVVDGVTIKGVNDAFSLAVWEKDGYTYSISVGKAMSQTDLLALAAAIQ